MSITHEQARKFIQLSMDQSLDIEASAMLTDHLRSCKACRTYANEIQEVSRMLTPVMQRQWNAQSIPLSVPALIRKERTTTRLFLTMRTATLSVAVLVLFFSAWQFVTRSGFRPTPMTLAAVPTPSGLIVQSTNTQFMEGCSSIAYTVQETDTLLLIAERFAVSQEELLVLNHLEPGRIRPRMKLMIPLCNLTATGTFLPTSFSRTDTPGGHPTTGTPGG